MKQVVLALYDYESIHDSHLNFVAGSKILIISKDTSGWWYGSHGGVEGWIPSNYVETKVLQSNDSSNISQLAAAVESLLFALDTSDRKVILDKAKNLWLSIKKLPQHKKTRKVERKISSAVVNPSNSMSEWVNSLEEVSYMCLDMIENIDFLASRPSTTSDINPQFDTPTPLVTPVSPEVSGGDLVFNSLGKVKSGTLKALLDYLTDYEKSDDVYQQIFLTTYSLHLTSKELLNHLRNTFYFKRDSVDACNLVVTILKGWISSFLILKSEQESFVKGLNRFLDTGIRSYSPDDANECMQLLKRSTKIQESRKVSPADVLEPHIKRLHSLDIIEDDVAEISTTLHNVYLTLFNQIQYSDWLLRDGIESESISQLLKFGKYVSKWVKVLISEEEEFAQNAFKVYKLIEISRQLFKLQNFQGVKDILCELRSDYVAKFSIEVDAEEFQSLHSLVTRGENNYSAYQQKLKTLEGFYIPLIMQHCTSILVVHNQVKSFTFNGLVNFAKMAMLSYSIEKILVSQRLLVNKMI